MASLETNSMLHDIGGHKQHEQLEACSTLFNGVTYMHYLGYSKDQLWQEVWLSGGAASYGAQRKFGNVVRER